MKLDDQQYSHQDFRSIVESSQDAIMRFDKKHRHLYVNEAVKFLTEIPQKDFIGKTHEELGFPKYLCDVWTKAIEYVFESKSFHKIEFKLPNGKVIDWVLVPDFDETLQVSSVITTARDVTQFKEANQKLLENEKRLKDAFMLNNLRTWEINVLNKQIVLNEDFCSLIGLEYKGEGHLLESSVYLKEWVFEEDKERFNAFYNHAITNKNENPRNLIEYRFRKPNGELIWVRATIMLGVNDDGVVYKAYGTVQDITHEKRTEDELEAHRLHLEYLVEQRTLALKQSEDKLLDAIQLANLSTWNFNLVTEEIRFEGQLEKKLTSNLSTKNKVIQFESFVDVIDPRDFKMFYAAFEKANKTTSDKYLDKLSYRMLDRDGGTHHLNLTIKVRLNEENNVKELYGTIQDITHIISSKTENERLNAIIEATSDIVGICDSDKRLIYLNKSGKNFYNISDSLMTDPNIENIQYDMYKKILNDDFDPKGYWIGENFLNRDDGSIIPVSQIVIAHRLENGDLDCYSTIIRDISELKQTEENLKYKNNELDTFVYRVSHDLRGPIASMLGLYNVVKHEIYHESSLVFFEMYNNQILRLNETIIALIDLTRIKESTTDYKKISFEEIVDGSINSLTHLAGYEKTQFEKKYSLNNSYSGDKALITTIIQNLIENAIKYYRPEVKSIVKILIETNVNDLIIKVSDNGRGIKKGIQGDVFNMFFRGDDTNAIGSGLGLYILKNAVDKLEGAVSLVSEVSKGTSFTVTIPLQS